MKRALLLAALAALAALGTGSASASPSIDDLAWMVGSWVTESGGARSEEHWIEAVGGMMLGLHRDRYQSGKTAFEYLRIHETDDGIDYVASPGGKPGTPFSLVSVEGERAVFSNPDHDWPKRVTYWIEDGKLWAQADGGPDDAEARAAKWSWSPAPRGMKP